MCCNQCSVGKLQCFCKSGNIMSILKCNMGVLGQGLLHPRCPLVVLGTQPLTEERELSDNLNDIHKIAGR